MSLGQSSLAYQGPLLTLFTMILSVILDVESLPTRYVAPLFAVAALVLLYWPMFLLRRHGRARDRTSYMDTATVVDRGPFAVVRHPQYLGYMCLNATFMLITPHWLLLLVGVMAIVLFYQQAQDEEQSLLAKFDEDYQEYMNRVPRFNILAGLRRLARRRSEKRE